MNIFDRAIPPLTVGKRARPPRLAALIFDVSLENFESCAAYRAKEKATRPKGTRGCSVLSLGGTEPACGYGPLLH
jgi:hypothetical protein